MAESSILNGLSYDEFEQFLENNYPHIYELPIRKEFSVR